MKTIVYVDAFNLYYGAVKKTAYKWLDLQALCRIMLRPDNEIIGFKYFTALVKPFPGKEGQLNRQRIYLRALETISDLEVIYGYYLSHNVMMPLANIENGKVSFVKVIKTEEKGSDVNIATHMLIDAFEDAYDCAVLISGDSDLTLPIEMVRSRFGKMVGVLNPQKRPCKSLKKEANFYKKIRKSALMRSQFPEKLHDIHGIFYKPATW
jgi:uncharacterized LabA/DUF88 family protein